MDEDATVPADIRNTNPSNSGNCSICSGLGYARSTDGAAVARCDCQRQALRQMKLNEIAPRFRSSTFANYVPRDRLQRHARDAIAGAPFSSYFLFGGYARGKTHLATAQYKTLVAVDRPCLFLSMAELIADLSRADLDGDYFCLVRQRARHALGFHLFIDDIDKFKSTDYRTAALFDLFDTLYKRQLGLTVTSNYSLSELASSQQVHPAIVRRLDDMCRAVEV